jgi:hypothetical protein
MLKSIFAASAIALAVVGNASAAEKPWTDEEQAAGIRKLEFVRYAFAGKQQTIQLLYALNPDCSEVDGWVFEITKQPEHGVANVEPSSFFPIYPKDNPRYKCNEHKIQGQILTYQPKDGYKGQDTLVFLEIAPSGIAWEKTFHFNVRAPAKARNADVIPLPNVVIPSSAQSRDCSACRGARCERQPSIASPKARGRPASRRTSSPSMCLPCATPSMGRW